MATSIGSVAADLPALTLEVISVPERAPLLTPGLSRALARLIRNGPSCRAAEVVQIDGERHPRALAS